MTFGIAANGAAPVHQQLEDAVDYPDGLIPPTRRRRSHGLIGDVIVELGFALRETVDAAVAMSFEQGRTTGQLLIESGALRPDQLARALAERFGVDYVDLAAFDVDPVALALIDAEIAERYQAVPVGFMPDGTVLLAMADPTNILTLDELSMITERKMRPAAAAPDDLASLIETFNRIDHMEFEDDEEPEDKLEIALGDGPDPDAPVVKLVRQIIAEGVKLGASDIHCDPEAGDMKVLFRVDGVIRSGTTIPRSMARSVVSRIKIMSGLNIAERRAPQDGRMAVRIEGRAVDVRVVSLPLVTGEGVVLRILDPHAVVRDLESLGMQPSEREHFEHAIAKPYGAILVTGPTGSGKSTTLYGALTAINDGERTILTIEDPVEAPIAGIKQMQVAVKSGVTFARGLRSILRADPDVIMVGEIRDRETAEIAIQAALTGHLMLSTLHTRNAPSAITRLVDMGVEPFMVAAAIDCVVAQRLARALCVNCKREAHLSDAVRVEHGLDGAQVFEPGGCMRCGGTGYRGRIGFYEVMTVNEEVRRVLLDHRGVDELAAAAGRNGMRSMRQDGIDKVRQGITSLVEVGRVTNTV
jgi:type IV pilus assembly protein PilB